MTWGDRAVTLAGGGFGVSGLRVASGLPLRTDRTLSPLDTIDHFNVDDLVEASANLRRIGRDKGFMVDVAADVAQYLRGSLDGCSAVIVHKSHAVTDLPPGFADDALDGGPRTPRYCLARLAVAGAPPEGGAFAPDAVLLDAEALRPSALLGAAIQAFGVTSEEMLDPLVAQRQAIQRRTFGVFHLELGEVELDGGQRTPLERAGIRSLIGLGGGLLTGHVFVVWLLCTVPVPMSAAMLFRSLAPAVQSALVPTTFRSFR